MNASTLTDGAADYPAGCGDLTTDAPICDCFADGGDDRDGSRAMRAVAAACVIGALIWVALLLAAK